MLILYEFLSFGYKTGVDNVS